MMKAMPVSRIGKFREEMTIGTDPIVARGIPPPLTGFSLPMYPSEIHDEACCRGCHWLQRTGFAHRMSGIQWATV